MLPPSLIDTKTLLKQIIFVFLFLGFLVHPSLPPLSLGFFYESGDEAAKNIRWKVVVTGSMLTIDGGGRCLKNTLRNKGDKI